MRPNSDGGYTLENRYETDAMSTALAMDGYYKDAIRLAVDGNWQAIGGNIHPSILGEPEKVLHLNSSDSELVISSLRKVASGRLIVPSVADELIAQSMIARIDGEDFFPKANRIRKSLTRVKKFFFY